MSERQHPPFLSHTSIQVGVKAKKHQLEKNKQNKHQYLRDHEIRENFCRYTLLGLR